MATITDIGQLITSDPLVRQGRPCISGTGVSVRRVIGWYKMGLSPEEIADKFGHLSLAQVHAAITYYHANCDEMEREMHLEEAEEQRLYSEYRATKNQQA
jgi:uncharacterized protein (DUF433 family)